jgi:selenocysteine lyase/cysteine desulfurase
LGPDAPDRRAPTVALAHRRRGEDLANDLTHHKIMAGGDHFYAYRLVKAMGIDPDHGVLRVSFVHYTTRDEVDRLIRALDAVL